ncbi:MAG: cysteine--tRNA ligase [Defluviitaleaceae bacterium]|nr:cysteine--tRNA ligase [Defluviitaleaceae bacterium]
MIVYNTLTKKKEKFKTIEENKVSMYVCGPTVYNFIHIGNARTYIVFDAVRRYFKHKGYDVTYVQNYTDIDDRIIQRANEENITSLAFADRYIMEFEKDIEALNILAADFYPRVTSEISGIVEMITTLIEKGFAYEINGSVYFDTSKSPEYGKLSRRDLDSQEAGFRIDIDDEKKHPGDFILWKPKKDGEPYWESPWSEGRPGWHIECSVMAKRYLGENIDIHAGGEDLVFPHHENEIAQSEAANGKPFANYWFHGALLNIDNQKMSKSLGNFFTLRDVGDEFGYDVVRFFILSSHYRSAMNFTRESLAAAGNGLMRIKQCHSNIKYNLENTKNSNITKEELALLEKSDKFHKDFEASMDDDFNTADAISAIFEFVRFINKNMNADSSSGFLEKLCKKLELLSNILGLVISKEESADSKEIEELVAARTQAKKDKNFALADEIREKLTSMGVTVEDTRQGVRWYFNE